MSARPPLRAVVFDAGGTLIRLDFEWMASAVVEWAPAVTTAVMRRAEVDGRRAYDRSRGDRLAADRSGTMGDIQAYFRATLLSALVPSDRIDAAFERIWARNDGAGLWSRPMEGAALAVRELNRLGVRCAVVSNSDGRAERHLIDAGMREGFEFVVDSHVVGVEKPDSGIFAIALDRMGVAANEALYIGDIQSVDSAGARGAGMHFVLIDPWGDYAALGVRSLPGIADLPEYVSSQFTILPHDAGWNPASARSDTGGSS